MSLELQKIALTLIKLGGSISDFYDDKEVIKELVLLHQKQNYTTQQLKDYITKNYDKYNSGQVSRLLYYVDYLIKNPKEFQKMFEGSGITESGSISKTTIQKYLGDFKNLVGELATPELSVQREVLKKMQMHMTVYKTMIQHIRTQNKNG